MKTGKAIRYFIIDFDSTFIQSEGLEELAAVALKDNPDRENIIKKIKKITNLGMEGKISFSQSLKSRLALLQGNRLHIDKVVRILKRKISKSIKNNKEFFKKFNHNIYIISGGFKEFILPIVKPFGISKNHVFANSFILDRQGKIIGLDKRNLLSQEGGKVRVVRDLKLDGEIIVVGDGYTDYQIKSLGAAKHFVAFTENIKRQAILERADHVAPNFDEFLFVNNLPRSLSYPKNRIKVLLVGKAGEKALQLFRQEGYQIIKPSRRVNLFEQIKSVHIFFCDSPNYLSKKLIKNANLLMVIGIFYTSSEVEKFSIASNATTTFDVVNSNNIVKYFSEKGITLFFEHKDVLGKRIIDFINTGNTTGSLTIPQVRLKKEKHSHRLLHIHRNVPGILAKINSVMAKSNINILAQFLKTNREVGYVITDVNKRYDKKVLHELKKIPDTIRFRVLY